MEVAASLRERGLDVTVVAKQSRPFEKQLGARIGAVFQTMHEGKGVLFRMQRKVARLDGDGAVQRVLLTNGESIAADLVVVGLGIRPATSFLKDVEVPDDGGIPVDGSLRVADRLFAAGDVAAFPLRGDGPCIRLEHWRVAEQHGRLAARNMLGEAERYEATPYFWTIQYMQRLDYVGQADGSDPLVVRGSLGDGNGKPDFIAYYLRDGKVAAGAGLGRDRDMAAVLALMGRRDDWTVDELHPPDSSPAQVLQQQRWPVQL
jgi:NADPH-dependent 2,4-dienoyl-CoA reductase/sulfur reductase-like enzyme